MKAAICGLLFFAFCPALAAPSCGLLLGGEWGQIKTAIIGNPVGARYPQELPQMLKATLPSGPTLDVILKNPGRAMDPELLRNAVGEVDQFIRRLQSAGVDVLQPKIGNDFFDSPIVEKEFQTTAGLYAAMPRDNLLLLPPNLVVMAPMAWRSRYREHEAYREVLSRLEQMGLRVVEAPRPQLGESSYASNWRDEGAVFNSVVSNHEPLFDAADFIRLGNHIVGQLSHVTNKKGVEWIRKTMDPKYRLHIIEFQDSHPMHVDASLMPLTPGKILINPERVPTGLRQVLSKVLLKGWKMIEVPHPDNGPRAAPLYFTSRWINMNILVGDEWAFIEKDDRAMADLLKKQNIEPIPTPFQHFQALGGSFHCCSLDVRDASLSEADGIEQAEDLHFYFDKSTGKYKVESLEAFLAH